MTDDLANTRSARFQQKLMLTAAEATELELWLTLMVVTNFIAHANWSLETNQKLYDTAQVIGRTTMIELRARDNLNRNYL